ncbi:dimethylsulfonioproprionate lyase family protein [Pseudaestuariivita atlantica]|uniref:dimethylsulfonioproprionate lyase family protein n=1 Tax=Pseudaestuariivita atlantica TaxID=1317121 RepID=UPI00067B4B46|nr:dimethylsulfonioproprionate lyase family protein [Pseudaestuariivita atlantica]
MTRALTRLRDTLRAHVTGHAPDIAAFCGTALAADHRLAPVTPRDLPATRLLPGALKTAEPPLAPVIRAIVDAAPHVAWRHSYAPTDLGIGAGFLDRSGWFNLIAPSGPFVHPGLRLSIGIWDAGLHYPRHWHAPEEIYLVLSGPATFLSDGRAPRVARPGDTVHHAPNQPHAAQMGDAPLLAAAFWTGRDLEVPSTLAPLPDEATT